MDWNFSARQSPQYGPQFLAPVVDDSGSATALPFVVGHGGLDASPQNDSSHIEATHWVGWRFPEYSKDAREVSLPPGCGDVDCRSLDLPYILALIATVAPATDFLDVVGLEANVWATGEFRLPRHPDARNHGNIVGVDESDFPCKAEAFLSACAEDQRFRAFVVPKVNWDVFSGGRRNELQRVVNELDIRRFDGTVGQNFPSYHLDRRPLVITVGQDPDDLEALVRLFFDTRSRRRLDVRFSREVVGFVRSGLARPVLAGAWGGALVAAVLHFIPAHSSRLYTAAAAVLVQRGVIALWSPASWIGAEGRRRMTVRARESQRHIRMALVKLWYALGGIGSIANSVTMHGGGVDRVVRIQTFMVGAAAFATQIAGGWRQRLVFGACVVASAFWLRETLIERLERFGGRLHVWGKQLRSVGIMLPFVFALCAALVPIEGLYVLSAVVYIHDGAFPRMLERALWRHTVIQKLSSVAIALSAISVVGISALVVAAMWTIRWYRSVLPMDPNALLSTLNGVLLIGGAIWASFVCLNTFHAQQVRADSVRAYVRLDERRGGFMSGED